MKFKVIPIPLMDIPGLSGSYRCRRPSIYLTVADGMLNLSKMLFAVDIRTR